MSRRATGDPDDGTARRVLWGVDHIAVSDPAEAAPAIALERGAELVTDDAGARAAVDRRRTVAALTADGERTAELRHLAGELERAERIRARTEDGFRDVMAQRLSRASGVALHPTSIRRAAAAVVDAERDLVEAEASLAARSSQHAPPSRPRDLDDLATIIDEDALDARHRIGSMAATLLAGSVAVGVIALAVGLSAVVAGVIGLVGFAVTAVVVGRAWRASPDPVLASEQPRPQPAPARPPRDPSLRRSRAEERLRSARRHWETLVGPNADAHDLDAVLRAHDPQFDLAAAKESSPTIRAVSAVQRRAAARWRVAWAELGYDEPPDAARLDDELRRLQAESPRPLLLVEPARWLREAELAELVAALPPGTAVTIVERKPARSLKAG